MSEADDLARRFFALWAEYLTALMLEPKTAEPLREWLAMAAAALPGSRDAEPPTGSSRSASAAAAPPGSPGSSDAAVVELARRLDELTERVAALERRRRPPARPRRRDRPQQT